MKLYSKNLFVWTLLLMSTVVNSAGWIYVLSHSHTVQKWILEKLGREGLRVGAYLPAILCLFGSVMLARWYWKIRRREVWWGKLTTILCCTSLMMLPLLSVPEVLLAVGNYGYVLSVVTGLFSVAVLSAFCIFLAVKYR